VSDIITFEQDGLVIRVTLIDRTAQISWRGTSDIRNPDQMLSPFLRNLVKDLKNRETVIDFTLFEYMNSATLSPLMHFIKDLDSAKIKTVLVFSNAREWQRVTYRCMKAIARTLSHLSVESR